MNILLEINQVRETAEELEKELDLLAEQKQLETLFGDIG